jgi:hypothetical protein
MNVFYEFCYFDINLFEALLRAFKELNNSLKVSICTKLIISVTFLIDK